MQDHPQSAVHGQRKRAAHQGATTWTGDHGGRKFLQGGVEVPSTHPEVVHGERDEALGRAVMYRPKRDRILSEFSVFSLPDDMIGAFRG